jgi:hypothetical protein
LATKTSPADVANLIAEAASNYATSAQGAKADSAVQPGALDSYLPKSGGTMTGAIAMGAQKITNLGAPTATTDAATKAYVDGVVVAGGLNGTSPGWPALRTMSWDGPHWGATWEVMTKNNTNKVEGVAACLGNGSDSKAMTQSNVVNGVPDETNWGRNCFCRVSRVNNERVIGAWVFIFMYSASSDCDSRCAAYCSTCVRLNQYNACNRSNLFAAP